MKKILFALAAFALAGFASLNAETVTKEFRIYETDSDYAPNGHGGYWSVKNSLLLGNYYYTIPGDDRVSYVQFNLFEIDISADSFATIDSVDCTYASSFRVPYNGEYGETKVPEDLAAFSIEIFKGGTGDAKADYEGAKLISLGKFSGFTTKDFEDGLVKLRDLGIDIAGENYFTFAISIDTSLIPEAATGGMGVECSQFELTITGTEYVVPEPSTYAAIFGILALGLAVYRRRK